MFSSYERGLRPSQLRIRVDSKPNQRERARLKFYPELCEGAYVHVPTKMVGRCSK